MIERPPLRAIAGGRRAGPADASVVAALERALVAGLLHDPRQLARAAEHVMPMDFADLRLRTVYAALLRLDPEAVSVPALADELDRTRELERAGGIVALAELEGEQATGALVPEHARRVRRNALEHDLRVLHAQAAEGDRGQAEAIRAKTEELEALETRAGPLETLGFAGALLAGLRTRSQPASPLPGYLDGEPGLAVLSGRPKSGKTRLALWLALAWAKGHAPWPGAPELDRSPVFVLSAEQGAQRLDRTLRNLDLFSERPSERAWSENVTLVARDRQLPARARRMLRLDREGRAMLRESLLAGGPRYRFGVLDSLSRLKSPEVDENSADEMTPILQELQEIAEEARCHLLLVHHRGHDAARDQAVTAGRGSSAITAVPPVAWALDASPAEPHQRLLRVAGNDLLQREICFEVAPEDADPWAIRYWRPTDALAAASARIDELLGTGEEISTNELAWRIQGGERTATRPNGPSSALARALRRRWHATGQVTLRDGSRGSVLIRRLDPESLGRGEP